MSGNGRLLTFEVAQRLYALPISAILEVAETGGVSPVPTLPDSGGVMNWHGEALPVIAPDVLLGAAEGAEPPDAAEDDTAGDGAIVAREHVLVLSERGGEVPSLGLPIDAVHGLVEGMHGPRRIAAQALVIERRPHEGRVMNVLDTRRLVACARRWVEQSAA